MHLTACLQSRGEPPIVETVMIVNISSHGARVLSHRNWQPHEQLVLTELVDVIIPADQLSEYQLPVRLPVPAGQDAGAMPADGHNHDRLDDSGVAATPQ